MIEFLYLALILILMIYVQSVYEVGLKLFLLWRIAKGQEWIRKKSVNIFQIVMADVLVKWKWYFWEEAGEGLRKKKNRRCLQMKVWKWREAAGWG